MASGAGCSLAILMDWCSMQSLLQTSTFLSRFFYSRKSMQSDFDIFAVVVQIHNISFQLKISIMQCSVCVHDHCNNTERSYQIMSTVYHFSSWYLYPCIFIDMIWSYKLSLVCNLCERIQMTDIVYRAWHFTFPWCTNVCHVM